MVLTFFDEIPVEKLDRLQLETRTLHRHVAQSGSRSHTWRARIAWRARGGSIAFAVLLGCGGRDGAPPVDTGAVAKSCSGLPLCDGLAILSCDRVAAQGEDKFVVGGVIGDCTAEGACSLGRCMSPACSVAETDRQTFVGCLFYTAQADNVDSDAVLATSFLVSNPGPGRAAVELQQPGSDGSWSRIKQAVVAPGAAARLSIGGLAVEMSGTRQMAGLRIISDLPVTVAQIQSDDSDETALSSGGTIVLPVHVLGTHYRVMTYPQAETPDIAATPGSAKGVGRLIVVGTRPGTAITFTTTKSTSAVITGVTATVEREQSFDTTLNDGDVFLAWSGDKGDDLSGSEIIASQPVAVFSGNISTTYGKTAPGIHSPDMAHEQLPPIARWSHKYVASGLPPQDATCDTLLGQPGASVWRLLAANPGTIVTFEVPGAGPAPEPVPLGAGEVHEMVAVGDFVVTSTEPLLMTQGIDCEPSLSLAISADKLYEDVTFAVLPSFDQMIAIARVSATRIVLDGSRIDDVNFKPAGGGYDVARVTLPPCPASQVVCAHRLQGRFGMTLRGMDVLASYALTAPAWSGCIDTSDQSCVM